MKHRNNRLFWSAAGAKLMGISLPQATDSLPDKLLTALDDLPPLPQTGFAMHGEDLQGKRGRYIYSLSWKVLMEMGFQRPLRIQTPWGMELLAPFWKNSIAVIPQGFQSRVPEKLRALALVGKSAVFRDQGYHLVVCSAVHSGEAWSILQQGKCSVCTLDELVQLVNTLDFSH